MLRRQKGIQVSVLRGDNLATGIHDWERYVIVSDGVTTICEICDSREVRKLASRLERELLKARRERMPEHSGEYLVSSAELGAQFVDTSFYFDDKQQWALLVSI